MRPSTAYDHRSCDSLGGNTTDPAPSTTPAIATARIVSASRSAGTATIARSGRSAATTMRLGPGGDEAWWGRSPGGDELVGDAGGELGGRREHLQPVDRGEVGPVALVQRV